MTSLQLLVDVGGATLAAVHYSINSPLSGVQAGRYNYDIRSKSGIVLFIIEFHAWVTLRT